MYSGRSSETYLETRIRLYKQQTQKTSTSLPPDPNSVSCPAEGSIAGVYLEEMQRD